MLKHKFRTLSAKRHARGEVLSPGAIQLTPGRPKYISVSMSDAGLAHKITQKGASSFPAPTPNSEIFGSHKPAKSFDFWGGLA